MFYLRLLLQHKTREDSTGNSAVTSVLVRIQSYIFRTHYFYICLRSASKGFDRVGWFACTVFG